MIRAILVLLLACPPLLAAHATPLDTALAALTAEEAQPVERVRLFIERDGVADTYYIDRVRPGRFRMVRNPLQNGPETVIIDGNQWSRDAGNWRKTPAAPAAGLVPSMAGLIREGLTGAIETAEPEGVRVIEGKMVWVSRVRCEGTLLLRITAENLPALLRFEGACGGKFMRFRQAFSFAGPVAINPPE
jgi:hypothetical protein